jgi:hypothetical protein
MNIFNRFVFYGLVDLAAIGIFMVFIAIYGNIFRIMCMSRRECSINITVNDIIITKVVMPARKRPDS